MSARVEEEEAAAAWALRHPLSAVERRELEMWLSADPCRSGLLLRAMAALSVVDRAISSDVAPVAESRTRWGRRGMIIGAGGAIAAAVAGIIGWTRPGLEHVVTRKGEIRRLPLSDGSVATINTESELRVAFGAEDRRIALDRGQAWFQVAKDRRRPFVVDAGVAQARAVGTAFSVDRRHDGVRVSVTEGTVAVWATGARGAMTILQAGQFAMFDSRTASSRTGTAPQAIERALAWRNGEISLEDEKIATAVAQFNRYNQRQLVIADPALANERLVGLFQIDKPEDFASTLSASHDVVVTIQPGRILLSREKVPSN